MEFLKQSTNIRYAIAKLLKLIQISILAPSGSFLPKDDKQNRKLKFCYRKNKYLTEELHKMLCNALLQPHFDYAVQLGTLISMKKQKRKYK